MQKPAASRACNQRGHGQVQVRLFDRGKGGTNRDDTETDDR